MIETVTDITADYWPVAERDWENHYFYGLLNGKRYARLHLQFIENICYIHLYIELWHIGVLRKMRSDFEELKEVARGKGATRLVGVVGFEGKELDKWQRMLRAVGFPKASHVEIAGEARMMTVLEI